MQEEIANRIAEALGPYEEVLAAWVFGSVARSTAGPDSDVDVAILDDDASGHPGWRRIGIYSDALEQALSPRSVDVVLLRQASIQLADRILREGILVVDRDPIRRCDFEEISLIRYFDDLPMQRAWERDFDESMKRNSG